MRKRITLDLEEYEELVSHKEAIENKQVVIIRRYQFFGGSIPHTEVYTKETAVSELAAEINRLSKLLNDFKRISIWQFIKFKYEKI